jgi:hypothetical protein
MNKRIIKTNGIVMFLFITITFFQSCGVVPSIPYEPIVFDKETTKKGLIFGSITFPNEKARFNGYFIQIARKDTIKKIANRNSTEVSFSPEQIFKMKHDGQLENGKTYLFTLEREEGKYAITGLRLFSNYGYSTRTTSINGFSIPFDVKKGEITYVGDIIFDEKMSTNEHPVKINNNFKRDVDAIDKIQPSVDWGNAIDIENIKINYSKTE